MFIVCRQWSSTWSRSVAWRTYQLYTISAPDSASDGYVKLSDVNGYCKLFYLVMANQRDHNANTNFVLS